MERHGSQHRQDGVPERDSSDCGNGAPTKLAGLGRAVGTKDKVHAESEDNFGGSGCEVDDARAACVVATGWTFEFSTTPEPVYGEQGDTW